MNNPNLKKTRVALALLFFSLTFLSFIDLYEIIPESLTTKIIFLQFVPSFLKFIQLLSFVSIGFLIILIVTLILGRIYCSSICPLGILQDIFSFIAKKLSNRKRFYKFKKPQNIVRYSLLAIATISFIAGTSLVVNLLDPYSNTGRIFTYNFKPILVWINNQLSSILQSQKIYSLHIIELGETPLFITFYTILFLLLVAYLSYKRGRIFCNLICPVGTLLGLISKNSIFRIEIIENNCTQCGRCANLCKSECIDLKNKQIDYSRCVTCFNCLPVCEDKAIEFRYKQSTKTIENKNPEKKLNRRTAISTLLAITASSSILSQNGHQHKHNRRHARHKEYKLAIREFPVTPPGSKSIERFNKLCTACGLCISTCPTNVLQPAIKEYGLIGFMQPHMDYAHTGFCNFDCNRCGEICPTGAILPLNIEEKQTTQLGKAIFIKRNCVVHRDGTDCGACSEHCPTKAVDMVPYRDGLVIPKVNQDICIGCGACEHPCPVEYPHKAIYVEGNAIHELAKKPIEVESSHQTIEEDFPF